MFKCVVKWRGVKGTDKAERLVKSTVAKQKKNGATTMTAEIHRCQNQGEKENDNYKNREMRGKLISKEELIA